MAEAAIGGGGDTTLDAFFGGRLLLRQPARGHRAGTDAVLLAAAVPRDFSGRVLDVGAGVGAAGLGVALACPRAAVDLIERDAASAALAAENIATNALRARVLALDILSPARRDAGTADLVISNPPFHDPARVRASPDPARRAAHVGGPGGLAAWVAACLDMAGAKGSLILVHRADAVPALLAALEGRAGAIALKPILGRAGQEATRVLVRATKGSRAPFRLVAPLVLHEGASFTAEAEAIHRGESAVKW